MGDAVGFRFDQNIVLVGDEVASAHGEYGFNDFRNSSFGSNVYWAASNASVSMLQAQVCAYVLACVRRACVRACVRMYVLACGRAGGRALS